MLTFFALFLLRFVLSKNEKNGASIAREDSVHTVDKSLMKQSFQGGEVWVLAEVLSTKHKKLPISKILLFCKKRKNIERTIFYTVYEKIQMLQLETLSTP